MLWTYEEDTILVRYVGETWGTKFERYPHVSELRQFSQLIWPCVMKCAALLSTKSAADVASRIALLFALSRGKFTAEHEPVPRHVTCLAPVPLSHPIQSVFILLPFVYMISSVGIAHGQQPRQQPNQPDRLPLLVARLKTQAIKALQWVQNYEAVATKPDSNLATPFSREMARTTRQIYQCVRENKDPILTHQSANAGRTVPGGGGEHQQQEELVTKMEVACPPAERQGSYGQASHCGGGEYDHHLTEEDQHGFCTPSAPQSSYTKPCVIETEDDSETPESHQQSNRKRTAHTIPVQPQHPGVDEELGRQIGQKTSADDQSPPKKKQMAKLEQQQERILHGVGRHRKTTTCSDTTCSIRAGGGKKVTGNNAATNLTVTSEDVVDNGALAALAMVAMSRKDIGNHGGTPPSVVLTATQQYLLAQHKQAQSHHYYTPRS